MKYKILKEFLPGVIVGQECNPKNTPLDTGELWVKTEGGSTIFISESYAKKFPEIFEPIIELKENETEFEKTSAMYDWYGRLETCNKCNKRQPEGQNFCSNCGRKRLD